MILLIGNESDLLGQRLAARLRQMDLEVVETSDPFTSGGWLTWELQTTSSDSQLSLACGERIDARELTGVFVHSRSALRDTSGWTAEDLSYIAAETQSALLAWLRGLTCRVINRVSADLWYRFRRPYPEWHSLLVQCGIPTLDLQITNDLGAARDFASRHDGKMTYAPLTSSARYPIVTSRQWDELANVIAVMPVCLMEPGAADVAAACLAGEELIVDEGVTIAPDDAAVFREGACRLADLLTLDVVGLSLGKTGEGWRCTGIDPYPRLEHFAETSRDTIVDRLAGMIGGSA